MPNRSIGMKRESLRLRAFASNHPNVRREDMVRRYFTVLPPIAERTTVEIVTTPSNRQATVIRA